MAGDLILDTSAVVAHLCGIATVTAQMQICVDAGKTLYLPLTAWGEHFSRIPGLSLLDWR